MLRPVSIVVLFPYFLCTDCTPQTGSRFQALLNRTSGLEASLHCPRPGGPVKLLYIKPQDTVRSLVQYPSASVAHSECENGVSNKKKHTHTHSYTCSIYS